MYRLATGLYRRVIFPSRGGVKTVGLENVPTEGGMILASNHTSSLDPPALAVSCRRRRLRALAKEELFKNKIFGAIITAIGSFPVKRGAGDTESIRKCIAILQGGEAVIVFPEGHRNDGHTMNPIQPGAAMLAKKAAVPVIPAGISGTHKGGKGQVTVVYGKPIKYDELTAGLSEREGRKLFLEHLGTTIQDLTRQAGLDLAKPEPAPST